MKGRRLLTTLLDLVQNYDIIQKKKNDEYNNHNRQVIARIAFTNTNQSTQITALVINS